LNYLLDFLVKFLQVGHILGLGLSLSFLFILELRLIHKCLSFNALFHLLLNLKYIIFLFLIFVFHIYLVIHFNTG